MEEDSLVVIDLIVLGLIYGLPLLVIIIALFAGGIIEKRHYASIRRREADTASLPAVPTKATDPAREIAESRMVVSGVVVSLDYFKRFLAGLRNIVGGRVQAYESLVDRARREAILRLKEQVPDCDIIVNLRLDTSNIASVHARKKGGLGAVEVLATGTAIRYR